MLIFITILLSGCNKQPVVFSKDLLYMDTYINIKIYNTDKTKANEALDKIDNLFKDYDHLADRYKAYNNLYNINYINNKLLVNQSLKIDARLYALLKYAKAYESKTNGLFNIALGNVIDVWAKYRNGELKGIPTVPELKSSGSINMAALLLKDDNTIAKTEAISLDLGAIAKGYVTELAGQYLDSINIHDYLITAGTSSVKAGHHYNNDLYKIGLTNPKETNTLYKTIKVANKSITTSGSYEQYYEYKGARYHHIIDPISLFPTNYMLSVTVITDDAALGEVLSTALFLMPIKDGLQYIKQFDNVEAIWYGVDGKITSSPGMHNYE